MQNAQSFFTQDDKDRIRSAVLKAELDTSGEIRVHIENYCKKEALDHASFLFDKLKMSQTEQRNGVLVYLAVKDKKFAIIGDSGINQVVEEHFWEDVKELMGEHFKTGDFVTGIEKGVELTGRKLKKHFPYHQDDINELSDEISYGG
ncbi:MAG: TPM domain-containing protein [Bacteroidales bacterium]|nr:TPM domain-containing protein [Bacteroidales bacterium]